MSFNRKSVALEQTAKECADKIVNMFLTMIFLLLTVCILN